jgi:hypothetical protein
MKNKIYFIAVTLAMIFSSCVKDIGVQVQSVIKTPDFNGIVHDAAVDIVLAQGPGYSIEYEGSDIVLGDLEFIVTKGKLIITQHGHYAFSGKSTLYITAPDLTSLESTSSGDIYSHNRFYFKGKIDLRLFSSGDMDLNIDAIELNTLIRGSGTMRLAGNTDFHEIEHDGFGPLYAYPLYTDQTRIFASSGGNSEIQVRNTLTVRLRGSGNITFIGYPFVDYSVTGFGKLIDGN